MHKTMKIGIALLFSIALLSFFPCAASAIEIEDPMRYSKFDTPEFYTESLEECTDFIEREKIPNGFPAYEELRFLGDFCSFRCDYPYYVQFQATYMLLDKNGCLLRVDIRYRNDDYNGYGGTEIDLKQLEDMRNISGSVYEGSDNSLEYKGMTLGYDADNRFLKYFEFYNEPWLYCVEIDGEYPHKGKNTWLMRFLNLETTDVMIDELHARLDGTYDEPVSLSAWLRKPSALVGIGAIGGAVVATLITFLVMRKRRTVVVAVASTESPTPPEDMATNDPPSEETPPPDN